MIPVNSLTPLLKQRFINCLITDLSLRRGIFVYKVEKSNAEIQIALFLEFILFIALMTISMF